MVKASCFSLGLALSCFVLYYLVLSCLAPLRPAPAALALSRRQRLGAWIFGRMAPAETAAPGSPAEGANALWADQLALELEIGIVSKLAASPSKKFFGSCLGDASKAA
jgi:hypothetical protein